MGAPQEVADGALRDCFYIAAAGFGSVAQLSTIIPTYLPSALPAALPTVP